MRQIGPMLVKLALQLIDDAGQFAAFLNKTGDYVIPRCGHAALRCQYPRQTSDLGWRSAAPVTRRHAARSARGGDPLATPSRLRTDRGTARLSGDECRTPRG